MSEGWRVQNRSFSGSIADNHTCGCIACTQRNYKRIGSPQELVLQSGAYNPAASCTHPRICLTGDADVPHSVPAALRDALSQQIK